MNWNKFQTGFLLLTFLFGGITVQAQDKPEKLKRKSDRFIAEAQELMADNEFAAAEATYRKAVATDPSNTTAKYNMGNLYHTKEKSVNAEQRLKQAAEIAATKEEKHRIYHNLGNTYMQTEDYQQAVDAYKEALRNDPTDDETRYNLALAKRKQEKQGQQQNDDDQSKSGGQDENEEKEKEKQQNQDGEGGDDQNENQQPKDEGENEKDKKEGDQNEDKDKQEGEPEKKDQGEGDKQKQQQQRPAQGQLSPQQIKSLLEAMNNEEKKVQDKINAEKAKGVKLKTEKDW